MPFAVFAPTRHRVVTHQRARCPQPDRGHDDGYRSIFIGAIFGNGGGNEVTNSNFLAQLQAKLGTSTGLKVFRDLKEVNDPEAPTTTSKPFPYDGVPKGPTP